jgi:hypothetical protein
MFLDALPDSVVSTLRTNEAAALAAAMIVAGAFPTSRTSPQESLARHMRQRSMRANLRSASEHARSAVMGARERRLTDATRG